jgi:hypothetical protein
VFCLKKLTKLDVVAQGAIEGALIEAGGRILMDAAGRDCALHRGISDAEFRNNQSALGPMALRLLGLRAAPVESPIKNVSVEVLVDIIVSRAASTCFVKYIAAADGSFKDSYKAS